LGRVLREVNALTWENWPLAARRRSEAEMEATARERAVGSASRRRTAQPAAAASWAIPEPICPAPITPTAAISLAVAMVPSSDPSEFRPLRYRVQQIRKQKHFP
jgi:hypothetical protein